MITPWTVIPQGLAGVGHVTVPPTQTIAFFTTNTGPGPSDSLPPSFGILPGTVGDIVFPPLAPGYVGYYRLVDNADLQAYNSSEVIASNAQVQFGGALIGSNFAAGYGDATLYRNVASPIAGNAVGTADSILDGIVLPANAFDIKGRGLLIELFGNLAATANNKRIKVWANPTMVGQTVSAAGVISGGTVSGVGSGILLYDSGVQTGNNVGWQVTVSLYKYGASGSNTQLYQSAPIFNTTHGGVSKILPATLPENAAINLVVTGSSPTTGAAGDVLLLQTIINMAN
jgi:hypothetical protein